MAYIHRQYCSYCRIETDHINGGCTPCAIRLERERIAIWNSKTIEEKLDELLKRIDKLEAGRYPILY